MSREETLRKARHSVIGRPEAQSIDIDGKVKRPLDLIAAMLRLKASKHGDSKFV